MTLTQLRQIINSHAERGLSIFKDFEGNAYMYLVQGSEMLKDRRSGLPIYAQTQSLLGPFDIAGHSHPKNTTAEPSPRDEEYLPKPQFIVALIHGEIEMRVRFSEETDFREAVDQQEIRQSLAQFGLLKPVRARSLGREEKYNEFIGQKVTGQEKEFSVVVLNADLLEQETVLQGVIDRMNTNEHGVYRFMWNGDVLYPEEVDQINSRIENEVEVNPERFAIVDMRYEINPALGMSGMLEKRALADLFAIARKLNPDIQTEQDLLPYVSASIMALAILTISLNLSSLTPGSASPKLLPIVTTRKAFSASPTTSRY